MNNDDRNAQLFETKLAEEVNCLIAQHEVEILEIQEKYEDQLQRYAYKDDLRDEWEQVHQVCFDYDNLTLYGFTRLCLNLQFNKLF